MPPPAPHIDVGHEEVLLSPDDVLRLTVAGSGTGSALEAENEGQRQGQCLSCLASRKQGELSKKLRTYTADEARNQACGLALQAYFRLAEARGQIQWAKQALEALDQLVAQVEELEQKGLPVPEALRDVRRSRSDLLSEALRLQMLSERLHEQLRQALLPAPGCIRTFEVFHVDEKPIDEKHAIEIGLSHRPDLNLLRTAICSLDASTLPAIRQMMASVSSLLAGPAMRCFPMAECLMQCMPHLLDKEIEKMRKQLESLLDDRQRQAIGDIRQSVRNLCLQVKLVHQAREREALARKKLEEMQEKADKGVGDSAALPLARREYYKARSDLLHEAIEWEIARAKIAHSQGMLVHRAMQLAGRHAGQPITPGTCPCPEDCPCH